MVAYLHKSEGGEGFHQIVDFLTASHISTLKNEDIEITATIDGKVKVVSKASIRRHLKLEDSDGISDLPTTEIFEQLALMGSKKTAWEQFSSNIATAIICLATNRTFNFSKLIFDGMVKNLDSKTKFLMYPRFIQIFLNKHKRLLLPHKRLYIAPTLTQKLFSNMKRASKGYTGVDTPLFQTMLVQGQILQGEGSTIPVESHHTPTVAPSTSQPHHSPTLRDFIRQETEVPQPSSPTQTHVADEAASTGVDVRHGGAATTVSSLDAGQGSGNIDKTPAMPHDSPLPRVHTLGKQKYGAALTKLIKKVKKLEQTVKTSQARRRAKIVVLDDEESSEDTSKQGRMIEDIDQDARISLVTPTKITKKNVNTYTRRRRAVSTGSEGVSTASRIFSIAEESVCTVGASMPVSIAGMVQQVNIIIPSSSETTKYKELAQKLHEEEQARFNAEQKAKFNAEQEELLASETTKDEANPPVANIDWDDVQAQIQANEDLAQKLLEGERENISIEERARLLAELIDKRKKLQAAQRYKIIRNKPQTIFYEVKDMFDNVYKHVTSFVPMDSVMEKQKTKRAGLNLQEESSKRQKTGEGSKPTEELKADEISQEERFSSTDPTDDKERTLWVELKRLFEPDTDDILWKLQRENIKVWEDCWDKRFSSFVLVGLIKCNFYCLVEETTAAGI
ncbi:hypothetical protein Tco_0347170 [Tanacetum coccineum]